MGDIEAEERDWDEASDQDGDDRDGRSSRGILRWIARGTVVLALLGCSAWFWWLFTEIRETSYLSQTAPADAIAVFGAAEYNGRPSPVLTARLEHALDLYQRGLAPLLISLGGGAGSQYNPQLSEGAVGRDFFLIHGVPDQRIIAETNSDDTEESVERLAAIARKNHLRTILVVSDGTHMFRIQQLCRAAGLHVLLSPREAGKSVSQVEIAERYLHEMASYTLWRLHLH
ncbi:MAG: YdcF family protein [Acidobacteriaceae bacterium]